MVSNSEAHTGRPVRTSCSFFSIAWMSANVCVIGDIILYSNTVFGMLVSLRCQRNILKLGWLALKWCSSDWFSWWHNSSVVWVNSVMVSQVRCCVRPIAVSWKKHQAEVTPLSKGCRAVQLWPCSHRMGYSCVKICMKVASFTPPWPFFLFTDCPTAPAKKQWWSKNIPVGRSQCLRHKLLKAPCFECNCGQWGIVLVNPDADRFRSLLQNSAGCWNFWWYRQSPYDKGQSLIEWDIVEGWLSLDPFRF